MTPFILRSQSVKQWMDKDSDNSGKVEKCQGKNKKLVFNLKQH